MWPSALGKTSKVLRKAHIAQTAMAYCNTEKHADSVHHHARESIALVGKALYEQGYHCDLESFKAALNGNLPEAVPGIEILYNGIRCGTCGLVQSKTDSMRKQLSSHSIKAADMDSAVEKKRVVSENFHSSARIHRGAASSRSYDPENDPLGM